MCGSRPATAVICTPASAIAARAATASSAVRVCADTIRVSVGAAPTVSAAGVRSHAGQRSDASESNLAFLRGRLSRRRTRV